MGPISQLELDELDGATAVGGTTLPDLSCHVRALPRGQPGAGRRQFVPLGPGTTLQVGVPCWQETGCDAARARAVLLIPSRALPDAAPVPSPRPAVGAPGEGAQDGRVGSRGGRCGEGRSQPGSFGSLLPNWDLLSTSPGSGRCSAVSWGFGAAAGAAGKLGLQVRVAGEPPALAVVPPQCRQAGRPLQHRSQP